MQERHLLQISIAWKDIQILHLLDLHKQVQPGLVTPAELSNVIVVAILYVRCMSACNSPETVMIAILCPP